MKKRIAIADNNGGKFTTDLFNHWVEKGHEVKTERGANENLAQWADIYYVDTWDNNIHYLWKLYHGVEDVSRPDNWDNSRKPRIVVRALDWEVWVGLARDQRIIDWVDDCIVIAPHIEKKLREDNNWGDKIHLIRPGVNLKRFTLKTTKTDGFQLGMVLGDFWPQAKNHMGGLDIFTTLYQKDNRWRLHLRGQHEPGDYWKQMYEHYLDSRGIRDVVTLYPPVGDMNQWYEKIDVLLHPGMKEAFCYAVGEAMAKGIPAVVNEFYGSMDIWQLPFGPELYKTHKEAVEKITNNHLAPYFYRTFIIENYDAERMFAEYDKLLGL
jgi:hypothetical protein